ncbi:transposase [Pinisolibacter aquiterrae]|uniref:transposase n=1 Tax=Pinisolibacter aquiterrae TaxID=2815579 RepID=UPI001C3DF6B2|nr:transposase [Pinisolibacter aquiterrae]
MSPPLLPGAEGKKNGRPRLDERRVLNGTFVVLRTGVPWRDLPERYAPCTTVYNRFNRWAKAGIWIGVFEALSARSPGAAGFVASLIIRAHQVCRPTKRGAQITPLAALAEPEHQDQCSGGLAGTPGAHRTLPRLGFR